jgi:thymidine kinase
MSLEVVVGPMFAGKSSFIESHVRRFRTIGIPVLVIKPALDTRYGAIEETCTHDGIRVPCIAASTLMDIPNEKLRGNQVVILEEAQFFPDLKIFVRWLVDAVKRHVIVVGLDGDSQMNPFGQVLDCIPLADKVTKLTALCVHCKDGTPAPFTRRVVAASEQVLVGSSELYEPVCRMHHTV